MKLKELKFNHKIKDFDSDTFTFMDLNIPLNMEIIKTWVEGMSKREKKSFAKVLMEEEALSDIINKAVSVIMENRSILRNKNNSGEDLTNSIK